MIYDRVMGLQDSDPKIFIPDPDLSHKVQMIGHKWIQYFNFMDFLEIICNFDETGDKKKLEEISFHALGKKWKDPDPKLIVFNFRS